MTKMRPTIMMTISIHCCAVTLGNTMTKRQNPQGNQNNHTAMSQLKTQVPHPLSSPLSLYQTSNCKQRSNRLSCNPELHQEKVTRFAIFSLFYVSSSSCYSRSPELEYIHIYVCVSFKEPYIPTTWFRRKPRDLVRLAPGLAVHHGALA